MPPATRSARRPTSRIERIADLRELMPVIAQCRSVAASNRSEAMNEQLGKLRDLGQSLWLDNITRDLLDNGTLRALHRRVRDDRPDVESDHLRRGDRQQRRLRRRHPRQDAAPGMSGEALFMELALEDLRRAADLFRPVFDATDGVDGWVSMELSPLLAGDTAGSIEAAARIHRQADRANLFVKIPGTPEGVPAIEESIFNGVPINVTLLFSARAVPAPSPRRTCAASSGASQAGRDPLVASVASLFVSRWDKAVGRQGAGRAAQPARHRRRPAHLSCVSRAARIRRAGNGSPPPARVRNACSGPAPAPRIREASDTLYVEALAAPDTIDTMPEKTLRAFADHGRMRGASWRATAAMRSDAARSSQGRHRHRRARDAIAARRRAGLRQVVEGADAAHRRQEPARSPHARH